MTRPIPRPDAGQPLPVMLRLLDVVAMTQISESTLMTAVMAGEFPAPKRIGRSLRWSRAALQRWADHVERIVSGEALGNVVEMRGR